MGSVPTAYLAARLSRGIDIRKYGSGNVGATNVARSLGYGIGITALLLDKAKSLLLIEPLHSASCSSH